MKSSVVPFLCRAMAFLAIVATTSGGEIPESDLGAFHRPKAGKGGNLVEERAEGVVAEIEKTASFEKWKVFEDDRVKFL